ncbi:hypothetical protein Tco_1089843 [Tanacetum coccineum]
MNANKLWNDNVQDNLRDGCEKEKKSQKPLSSRIHRMLIQQNDSVHNKQFMNLDPSYNGLMTYEYNRDHEPPNLNVTRRFATKHVSKASHHNVNERSLIRHLPP